MPLIATTNVLLVNELVLLQDEVARISIVMTLLAEKASINTLGIFSEDAVNHLQDLEGLASSCILIPVRNQVDLNAPF